MSTKTIVIVVMGVLIIGAGSFFIGKEFSGNGDDIRSNLPQIGQEGQRGGPNMGDRSGMMGGGTAGEIIDKDDTSITVRLNNGESRSILISTSTSISKTLPGLLTDLVIGENVMVMGMANSDGSINAQFIQLGDNEASFR